LRRTVIIDSLLIVLIDLLLNLNQSGASFGATGTKPHLTFESMKKELIFKRKISLSIAFSIYIKKDGNSVKTF
jgi:hypothetical protein